MGKVAALVYLEPIQKKALLQRSAKSGTSVAQEIRSAVDIYLHGEVTAEELKALDIASQRAEASIKRMITQLKNINKRVDSFLLQREDKK
ncbi:MAG: hypothetical protein EPN94_10770 [Nitrospirae bacterium]|nr:MAG: hypothetical protein EPN94_10770 [Nitrospirota bacterium]